MKNNFILVAIFFVFMVSCKKIHYSIDNPISGISTKVLMHRGSGNNPDLTENTLPAAEYGLSLLDGIELDIQLSKDGTLWLDHDNEVHDCSGNEIGCFQEMTDSEIIDAAECEGIIRYHTLESVFDLMNRKYPDSYISLDVKGQYCEILNTPSVMKKMANSILALVEKYSMKGKVLVESGSLAFMREVENQNLVGQCIIEFGDIDKGMANARITKARGVSLKYGLEEINSDVVSLVHEKGYSLMVWVINEPETIDLIWHSGPDFIQTDRADFKDYIPAPK